MLIMQCGFEEIKSIEWLNRVVVHNERRYFVECGMATIHLVESWKIEAIGMATLRLVESWKLEAIGRAT